MFTYLGTELWHFLKRRRTGVCIDPFCQRLMYIRQSLAFHSWAAVGWSGRTGNLTEDANNRAERQIIYGSVNIQCYLQRGKLNVHLQQTRTDYEGRISILPMIITAWPTIWFHRATHIIERIKREGNFKTTTGDYGSIAVVGGRPESIQLLSRPFRLFDQFPTTQVC